VLCANAAEDQWLTDLPKAQAKAKTEKKMVLVDFTGSDWCPPCKILKKNVLSAPEFEKYAKDNLVLVELDYPQSKEQPKALKEANKQLSDKYKIEGLPTIIVFDSDGKQLFRETGYAGTTAKEYVEKLKKLRK
jgi:thioredoxin-related protein